MINLKIKKTAIRSFLTILLYKLILDISYYFVISRMGDYVNFELHLNSIKLVESYFLLFIVFVLMPKSVKKLSRIAVWLLILLSYVPMLTLFAFMDKPRTYMYAVSGFWLLVFLLLHVPGVSILPLKQSESKAVRYSIFIGLTGMAFFLIYKYSGFSFNFNLMKAYDIRSHYVELKIPLAGYLFSWVACILNPIFFVLFLTKRKWLFVALIVFLQLLLFSSTGNKIFLFALPFVLILTWTITRKEPIAWAAIGLCGIILSGILSYYLIGDAWVSYLFTRRVLLVPAQLSFLYYDFFSKNGYIFLAQHRIFRNFLDYPYHLDPPHLIGEVYFNRPQCNAVTGIIGDAYMNFGFTGLILWGILLVIILKLIDSSFRRKDLRIGIAAIAMPVMILMGSAFLTSLLTHGVLLALIVLYLLPKNDEHSKIE